MATMAEHESSMTIYYYKSDGGIYSYSTGINNLNIFGSRKTDYEQMLDYIVVDKDPTVMESFNKFYVDIETKTIKLKEEYRNLNKYL